MTTTDSPAAEGNESNHSADLEPPASPPRAPTARTGERVGARRETGPVSELPPPHLPPPGTPGTGGGTSAPRPPGTPADPTRHRADPTTGADGADSTRSRLDEFLSDPDWDRIRGVAEDWFRPLAKPEGWLALGYLFVGMLSSIGFFLAMVTFGAITFGLSFIGVGLLLIGPWFAMVTAFAHAERAMARWVGYEIPPRDRKDGGLLGWRSITDPERWRMVGYVALNVVLGPLLFSAGFACYGLVFRVLGSWGVAIFDFFPFNAIAGIFMLLIAIVALGAAPRVVRWVATLKANIAAWFLGPDKLALAEQRVTTLSSQRQDILDAVASERRRIERNLHDGVQQQLVAIGLDLGMAEQQLDRDPERARELVVQAREKVQGSIGELRQLGRGLHPAILEDRGIDAALSAVVSAAPIPISVHVDDDLDLDTDVAETVYFIANEAIANVLKHAHSRAASVYVSRVAANVRVTVRDDGRGGADPSRGTGLAGIRARVNAVDGSMSVTSPPGGPTMIVAELPRHVDRTRGAHHV